MSNIVLGTNVIRMDEGCWCIKELNRPAPDSKSVRRYRIISVWRGGPEPAEFMLDMGPADKFTADEFAIMCGVAWRYHGNIRYEFLHTVGEAVDMADEIDFGRFRPPPRPEPSDLIQAHYDAPDKRRRGQRNLSQFGLGGKVQRN